MLNEDKKVYDRNYLILGDMDKPFHKAECECDSCESWRIKMNRPTRKEVRKSLEGDTDAKSN